jgi:hypothetical protein
MAENDQRPAIPPAPPSAAVPSRPDRPKTPNDGPPWWIWIALASVVLVAVSYFATSSNSGSRRSSSSSDDDSSSVIVRYRVYGANQADITFQNEHGDTSQDIGATLPWDYGGFAATPGQFLYVSAQKGGTAGDIYCEIVIDDRPVESNVSSGEFAICTASGTV